MRGARQDPYTTLNSFGTTVDSRVSSEVCEQGKYGGRG